MMNWKQLISDKRFGKEDTHRNATEQRTEFQRDFDRLIFSAPFRRMQNKTQVFPLPGSIFVHNRLTHSLEVSSVGRSLGVDVMRHLLSRHAELGEADIASVGSIVSAACLAHDMGNPPFGHSGERAIRSYFTEGKGRDLQTYVSVEGEQLTEAQWADITHFDGNANTFRLLTHQFGGRRRGGFVMTYSTLAAIVKYPFASRQAVRKPKFGFFESEAEDFARIARELGMPVEETAAGYRSVRHPLVYLVEAADDICYEIMDIEDAHKLKLLTYQETEDLLLGFFDSDTRASILQRVEEDGVTDVNEKVVYMRACVECVHAFVDHESQILAGTFEGSLIKAISERPRNAYKRCTQVSKERIYQSKIVLDVELSGYKIMETLMRDLVSAAVSPEKFHSKQLIKRFSSQYDIQSDNLETRLMAVIDYISGMTDIYALDIYQKINGISLPII